MKKLFGGVCAIICALSLVACGTSETSAVKTTDAKGQYVADTTEVASGEVTTKEAVPTSDAADTSDATDSSNATDSSDENEETETTLETSTEKIIASTEETEVPTEKTTESTEKTSSKETVKKETTSKATTKKETTSKTTTTKETTTKATTTKATTKATTAAPTTEQSTTQPPSQDPNSVRCYQTLNSSLQNDNLYFIYYANLSADQKNLYNELSHGLADGNLTITMTGTYHLNATQVSETVNALIYDQPQYFYATSDFSYSYSNLKFPTSVKFTPVFTGDLAGFKSSFDQAVNAFLSGTSSMSDIQYEKYVHDKLCQNITYNTGASYSQSAYSAFVTKQTVCAGYAKAFQYCMLKRGIPCYYISGVGNNGNGTENHAWNMVCLENNYYLVDVTWDDIVLNNVNYTFYTYFNLTNSEMSQNHAASKSIFPNAVGQKYSVKNYLGQEISVLNAMIFGGTDLVFNSIEEYKAYTISTYIAQKNTSVTMKYICTSAVWSAIQAYANDSQARLADYGAQISGSFTIGQTGFSAASIDGGSHLIITETGSVSIP